MEEEREEAGRLRRAGEDGGEGSSSSCMGVGGAGGGGVAAAAVTEGQVEARAVGGPSTTTTATTTTSNSSSSARNNEDELLSLVAVDVEEVDGDGDDKEQDAAERPSADACSSHVEEEKGKDELMNSDCVASEKEMPADPSSPPLGGDMPVKAAVAADRAPPVPIIGEEAAVIGTRGGLVLAKVTKSSPLFDAKREWVPWHPEDAGYEAKQILTAAFNDQGSYLALGFSSGEIEIWSTLDILLLVRCLVLPPAHQHRGGCMSLSWTFDNVYLAASHAPSSISDAPQGLALLWKFPEGTLQHSAVTESSITQAALDPSSVGTTPRSLLCDVSGRVWLYDWQDENSCGRSVWCPPEPPAQQPSRAEWSRDGRYIFALVAEGAELLKLESSSLEVLSRFALPWRASPWVLQVVPDHLGRGVGGDGGLIMLAGRGLLSLPMNAKSIDEANMVGENVAAGGGRLKFWGACTMGHNLETGGFLVVGNPSAAREEHKDVYVWHDCQEPRAVDILRCPGGEALCFLGFAPQQEILLAVTNKGEAFYRGTEIISDFPGPMYPSGFSLIDDNVGYHEAEDELDMVITTAATGLEVAVPAHEVVVRGAHEIVLDEELADRGAGQIVNIGKSDERRGRPICIPPDLSHFIDQESEAPTPSSPVVMPIGGSCCLTRLLPLPKGAFQGPKPGCTAARHARRLEALPEYKEKIEVLKRKALIDHERRLEAAKRRNEAKRLRAVTKELEAQRLLAITPSAATENGQIEEEGIEEATGGTLEQIEVIAEDRVSSNVDGDETEVVAQKQVANPDTFEIAKTAQIPSPPSTVTVPPAVQLAQSVDAGPGNSAPSQKLQADPSSVVQLELGPSAMDVEIPGDEGRREEVYSCS
jgi:hypothetical protein